MGNGLITIGRDAFSDCHSSLYNEYEFAQYIRIGDNPYAILLGVTNGNMSKYTIHKDTKIIAESAFWSCSRFTDVFIPASVISIGSCAFYYCVSMENVYYSGSQSDWDSIIMGSGNDDYFSIVTIHYNYVFE